MRKVYRQRVCLLQYYLLYRVQPTAANQGALKVRVARCGVKLVVAVLETMWDWRQQTSEAGYKQAPRYFRISPANHSGRRLYKLVGDDARLLVTNACRELVSGPEQHGKGDAVWLRENLQLLDKGAGRIDLLLVCGKIAQATYAKCCYTPQQGCVLEMPHPAARLWTKQRIADTTASIQSALA